VASGDALAAVSVQVRQMSGAAVADARERMVQSGGLQRKRSMSRFVGRRAPPVTQPSVLVISVTRSGMGEGFSASRKCRVAPRCVTCRAGGIGGDDEKCQALVGGRSVAALAGKGISTRPKRAMRLSEEGVDADGRLQAIRPAR
jgi:hypothetical protein